MSPKTARRIAESLLFALMAFGSARIGEFLYERNFKQVVIGTVCVTVLYRLSWSKRDEW